MEKKLDYSQESLPEAPTAVQLFSEFIRQELLRIQGQYRVPLEGKVRTLTDSVSAETFQKTLRAQHLAGVFGYKNSADIPPERLSDIVKKSARRRTQGRESEPLDLFFKLALHERMRPGLTEPRTADYTRGALARFVLFLAKKGISEIQVIAGDLNYLKKYNKIDEEGKLGDAILLAAFYTAKQIADKTNGLVFIPNVGGGDDFLILYVNSDIKQVDQHLDEFNQNLKSQILDWSSLFGLVAGRELVFADTEENKTITPEDIKRYKKKAASIGLDCEELYSPSVTCVAGRISLQSVIDLQNHPIGTALEEFYKRDLAKIHQNIQDIKDQRNVKRE